MSLKFTCTVDIDAPKAKVAALFADPENYKKWQEGFVSIRTVNGTPGTIGSKSIIKYDTGKHKLDLLETITEMNLPDRMSALYEHQHMDNTMTHIFAPLTENKTKYSTITEYTKFRGFVPRMMALLMPDVFKKQTQQWLDKFKAFAENA
jgi:hypothetical protein